MDKREAKKYAYRQAASIVEGFLEADSLFGFAEEAHGCKDLQRVREAVAEVVEELYRRGEDKARVP